LKVNVFDDLRHKAFWFDFARGLMAVRKEYLYESPDKKAYNKEFTEVLEAKEIGGVWVPIKALRRSGSSVSRKETEILYEVTTFEVGTVKLEDVEIVFPPGTTVVNAIEKICYTIQSDGTQKPLGLYDPTTGTVKQPVSEAAVKVVTPSSYKEPERVGVPPAENKSSGILGQTPTSENMPSTRKNLWIAGTGAAILAACVLFIQRRRNRGLTSSRE
jgi:hypothetical protein